MPIEEVERRATGWLRRRHDDVGASFSAKLKGCVGERAPLTEELYADMDEALSELERIQSGMA